MAHGAVDAEELSTFGGVALGCVEVFLFGNSGAGSEAGDVGSQFGRLLVIELDGLLLGLRAVHRHGHAAGANLEIHGSGAYANQGGAVLRAAGFDAVAGGAVGNEELLALVDLIRRVRGGCLRLVGPIGYCVETTHNEESQQQQRDCCEGMTSPLR